ncbi:MAG TPA: hypothetical protein VFG30_37250 [Polyangiales bacterium]|nr:hypothetical protein [Polyangiales bacterium]
MTLGALEGPRAEYARRVWRRVRAFLITLVLLQQIISAWPAQTLTLDQLTRPEGERLVSVLERTLGLLGVERDREQIKQALVDRSLDVARFRRTLLRPFRMLTSGLASDQQWGLFLISRSQYFRMQIDLLRDDGEWHTIYRAGSFDELGLGPMLRYRRVRGLYNPSARVGPRRQYSGFVSWLANELFAMQRDARQVRVQMERFQLGHAGEPVESLGFEFARIRTRAGAP